MPDSETVERTVATIVLMLVWAALVLAPMFAGVEPPRYEIVVGVTMVAFTVLGKMWYFEVKRALDVVPLPDGGQSRDRDDDREE